MDYRNPGKSAVKKSLRVSSVHYHSVEIQFRFSNNNNNKCHISHNTGHHNINNTSIDLNNWKQQRLNY